MADRWLLTKCGLYCRPNAQGYTGLRARAEIYTHEVAIAHCSPENGLGIISFENAPEITPACDPEIANEWLLSELARLRAELEAAKGDAVGVHPAMVVTLAALVKQYRDTQLQGVELERWAHFVERALGGVVDTRSALTADKSEAEAKEADAARPRHALVWPEGCPKRSSCARHSQCMYGCKAHSGKSIRGDVEAEDRARSRAQGGIDKGVASDETA